MKRISSLILAAAFVFGSMGAAQAIDTKVKGTWDFTFGWGVHEGFQNSKKADGNNEDYFHARQGVTTQVNFIASENLQAVLALYIGDLDWGKGNDKLGDGAGADLDSDGINIKTRLAYLDWLIPDTGVSVRMGIQHLALPMATGYNSPVFGARTAGITTSYKFDDTFAATAFWARPFNSMTGHASNSLDKTDMFGLILPVTLDGVSITPWGTIARIGAQSGAVAYMQGLDLSDEDVSNALKTLPNQTTTAWWTGLGINVDLFDPLTFAVDVMYGHMGNVTTLNKDTFAVDKEIRASGWFVTSTLDYKLDWGTPGLFGWWSTGDTRGNVKDGKLGRMPVLGLDDGFNPLTFGIGGNVSMGQDNVLTQSGQGTWAIGAQIADMSFIEDLTHSFRVAYITGTNSNKVIKDGHATRAVLLNDENVYLTDKDHALEIDLTNTYQIYENLAATLELGYINLDLNKKTWGDDYVKSHNSDAWKAQVNLKYDF